MTGFREGGAATDRSPRGELRRSFGLRVATAAGGLLSTFVTIGLVSQNLPPGEAAVFLGVMAALMLGPMLGRFGLGQNVLRTIGHEADPKRRRHLAGVHVRVAVLFTLLTAPVVALATTIRLAGSSLFVPVTALTAVLILLETMRLMISDVFAATGHVDFSVLTTHHVRSILALPLLGSLFVLTDRATLPEVVLVYLSASLLPMLPVARAVVRELSLRARPARGMVVGALQAGLALFCVDGGLFLVGRGDVWLANAVFSGQDAHAYSTASTLAFQAMVLQGLASLAITPIAARMWAAGDRHDLVPLLRGVATLTTATTLIAIAVLAAVGGWGLELIAPGLGTAKPMLVVLALGGLGQAVFGMNITLLIAAGELRRAAVAAGLALAVVVPAVLVSAIAGGARALAVLTALAMIIYSAGQWLAVRPVVARSGLPTVLPEWNLAQAVRDTRRPRSAPSD